MFVHRCLPSSNKEGAVGAYVHKQHGLRVGRQLCSNPNLSSTRCVGTRLCVCLVYCSLCERAAFGWPSLGLGQKERGPKSPLKQRSSTATIPV